MKGAELERFEREDMIWRLRLQEKSLREIAEAVGLSHVMVGNILNARLSSMVTPLVEEYRQTETEKLKLLESYYWGKAQAGEYQAGQLLLKIRERMAKLWGLDVAAGSPTGEAGPAWHLFKTFNGETVPKQPDYSKLSEDELWTLLRAKQNKAIEAGE